MPRVQCVHDSMLGGATHLKIVRERLANNLKSVHDLELQNVSVAYPRVCCDDEVAAQL